MNYCAITADVVDSRNYDNRSLLIEKIKAAIEEINCDYQEVLAAKFIIYSGDELQGLLKEPKYSYQLIRQFQEKLNPIKIRIGVGIGNISTPVPADLNQAYTGELDGEAYHQARKMLEQAQKYKQNVFYYFDDPACELINRLIAFIDNTEEMRTERQWETVRLYEKLKKQRLVADKLDIDQTTVSRNLNRSAYYLIKKAEKSIFSYLQHI